MTSAPHREAFHGLNAMRGIAAALIVLKHSAVFTFGPPFTSAYLAVDFFFQLSGFVLAHAYEGRFARDLTLGRFLIVRLIRLYPLYLLGTLVGFIAMALILRSGRADLLGHYRLELTDRPQLRLQLPWALLFLPSPLVLFTRFALLYPLNWAAWSLLFELLANMLYRLMAPRLTTRRLGFGVCAAGVALLALSLHMHNLNLGVVWSEFLGGTIRVGFSFFLGVWLYRRYREGFRLPVAGTPLALLGLTAVLALHSPLLWQGIYDGIAVIAIFPLLLAVAASQMMTGPPEYFAELLGRMSYAIYALHLPLLFLTVALVPAPWLAEAPRHAGILAAVFLCALCPLSLFLDRYYDLPLRKALMKRLMPRLPAAE